MSWDRPKEDDRPFETEFEIYIPESRKKEMEQDFIIGYDGTPERSIISAYKRFLESGLNDFLNTYVEIMFSNGFFDISLYSKNLKIYKNFYDYESDLKNKISDFHNYELDSEPESKKFLIMDVDWDILSQKLKAYQNFADNDNDYFDFYRVAGYFDLDSYDNYDVNDNDYYHQETIKLSALSHYSKDQGALIFCCELPIFNDKSLNHLFEERLMDRINFFFSNFIEKVESKHDNEINYYGKINRNELIKFRDEELARINARLLEFGKSR